MTFKIVKSAEPKDLEAFFENQKVKPRSYFESRLKDNLVFAAKDGEKIVAFLAYSFWWGSCPFIELIKVKPDYQKQGLGTALLKAAANEIKEKGYEKLVSSTEPSNPMGMAFHTKFNFKKLETLALPTGEEEFYVTNINDIVGNT